MRGVILTIVITGLLFIISCGKDESPNPKFLNEDQKQFDIGEFKANVIQTLGTEFVGYAVVIIDENGQAYTLFDYGNAQSENDGDISMTPNRRFPWASLSKTITAIAVMQLLEEQGLTHLSSIAPWLPAGWVNPDVSQLKFINLLTHTSGLRIENEDFNQNLCYTCLKDALLNDISPNKSYLYSNTNYAVLQVLIAKLANENATITEANYELLYLEYINDHIFGPAGVEDVSGDPDDVLRYYNQSDHIDGRRGETYSSKFINMSSVGLRGTIVQFAQVMAYLLYSEQLVSEETRDFMLESGIGFDPIVSDLEENGEYYGKDGVLTNTFRQGVHHEMIHFPRATVIVFSNTRDAAPVVWGEVPDKGVNPITLAEALYMAYNKAYALP